MGHRESLNAVRDLNSRGFGGCKEVWVLFLFARSFLSLAVRTVCTACAVRVVVAVRRRQIDVRLVKLLVHTLYLQAIKDGEDATGDVEVVVY